MSNMIGKLAKLSEVISSDCIALLKQFDLVSVRINTLEILSSGMGCQFLQQRTTSSDHSVIESLYVSYFEKQCV